MSYKQEAVYGSIMRFSGAILAAAIAYVTKLVLVRNLSVEEYGLFFSVLTFILFFQVFVTLGLPAGLSRTIAKYRVSKELGKIKSIIVGSLTLQMIIGGVFMSIIILLSDYLAINYFKEPDSRWILIILTAYFPLNILKTQFASVFNGFSKNNYSSLIPTLYNAGTLIIILVGFQFFSGYTVPAVAYIGGFLVMLTCLAVPFNTTFRLTKNKRSFFKKTNLELIKFSFPLGISTAGAVFISYFDTLMLTYFETTKAVGIYNIVYPTAMLLLLIGGSIGAALLPIITSLWERKKLIEIRKIYKELYIYILTLAIPALVILFTLAEDIIKVLFGQEYLSGMTAFLILLIGSFFQIFFSVHNSTLIGIGKSSSIAWIFVISSLANIILNIMLIPIFSVDGAAIATTISFLLMFIISYRVLAKELTIRIPIKELTIIAFSSSIVYGTIKLFWIIEANLYLTTLSGIVVGMLLYALVLIYLKILDIKKILNLFQIENLRKD